MTQTMVSMSKIRKEFPGVIAVDGVDFSVDKGEIMGLLGENGAGKSTLMSLLYGLYRMDGGSISIDGSLARIRSSHDAIALGIGMVHQAFTLVPNLTVRENIILGAEPSRVGILDAAEADARVSKLIQETGLPVNQNDLVENLPTGFKQRVEILKALFRGVKVLILDEPTAVLTPLEADELFRAVRKLAKGGTTVVFITHKLKEVIALTSRITVMRKGKLIGTIDTKDAAYDKLATMMVGRDVVRQFHFNNRVPGEELLEVKNLVVSTPTKARAVNDCSFDVRAGEIVGLAGVEGNGQSELIEALTGMNKPDAGVILIEGHNTNGMAPKQILDLSVGHVPEDRALSGLVLDFSIAENSVLGHVDEPRFSSAGLISLTRVKDFAKSIVKAFSVATPGIEVKARNLSGGNQQKVIVGRELSGGPHLLIAHQPTRGLDVASTEYIQSLLVQARNEGRGVLLVSADFDETLDLSDRILVLYEGKIIGSLQRGASIADLGKLLGGVAA